MLKSGVIFGLISLVLILGTAAIITAVCSPCIGIFLGLLAGYVAGAFDKPENSNQSMRRGAGAGAIAAIFGLLGGFIGAAIHGSILNPAQVQSIFNQLYGYSDFIISAPIIWGIELGIAFCAGLFNIAWMAIFGLVGGALWFSVSGKDQTPTVLPPQGIVPPPI